MSNRNSGRLGLKKETLRQLGASQLGQVVGGLASGINCIGNQNTGSLGSTLPSIKPIDVSEQEGGSR